MKSSKGEFETAWKARIKIKIRQYIICGKKSIQTMKYISLDNVW
jgi:hypothetical protein